MIMISAIITAFCTEDNSVDIVYIAVEVNLLPDWSSAVIDNKYVPSFRSELGI